MSAIDSDDDIQSSTQIQQPKLPGNYSARISDRWSQQNRRDSINSTTIDGVHSKLSLDHIFPAQLYSTESGRLFHAGQVLIVLVGLPARGKTHLAVSITRYLRWLGVKTHPFHVGDYRRAVYKNFEDDIPQDYFSAVPKTEIGIKLRQKVLKDCLDGISNFFEIEKGQVAIYDALNALPKDRLDLQNEFGSKGIKVLFIESIVDDDELLARNVANAASSPDYIGWNPKQAKEDYINRIKTNAPIYIKMNEGNEDESALSFIKFINFGDRLIMNNSQYGYLINRIVFFLMNSKIKNGCVYFARCGKSDLDKYIDDEELNKSGLEFSEKLSSKLLNHVSKRKKLEKKPSFVNVVMAGGNHNLLGQSGTTNKQSIHPPFLSAYTNSHSNLNSNFNSNTNSANQSTDNLNIKHKIRQPPTADGSSEDSFVVWTATRKRTSSTANPFRQKGITVRERYQLNQLNPGEVADMTQDEIKSQFPDEYEQDLNDPYHHRYPRAESYHDLAVRMEPLLLEMERMSGDILIIAHESVLAVLYGYLMACSCYDIPSLKFPRNEIVEISYTPYENVARRIVMDDVEP
ncbi:6-phosphofructo-2-kinase/fructose-2,6-biphosphatase [Wickerhamomyces ciferrii]|uniref:6-phosphofructo-2-kinase/fructose-2,6-biphosphatase n=1 Tax=Wickerhamomyces ciferrii (strain ATCC 14091 / BCRC 22168 / CBS 111 / JCM 3599 / NBRC 0793 / NRRL Y-1031 F-60-10) TaxID=1206466 RepID=K0KX01_WICCF|nr:6-phosphofructo-2-kinase/fructose-2,6-biphosphatase [Wickerhamomyces ciferrii]CCH45628.1 6-phosphofructo-2-kinase/fructose-2,6-biphosphatase [Wickerhamomyces ciferrii]